MPTVVSKFMEKTEQALHINRTTLSGAVVAAVLFAYTYKVAYPLITRRDDVTNINNNLVKKNVQTQNGVKLKNNLSKRQRLRTTIPALNLQFILQFIKLVRIMIPNLFCAEIGLLTGHTTFLFLRTFLSIYVANLEGAIVKYIVRKEPKNFSKQLMKWFAVAIPATFINSMIKYLESKIALSFRTRLVDHSYKLYFKNQSYYRVNFFLQQYC
jgi:ATP-binding cassette subfamily D (ALD) protein 2